MKKVAGALGFIFISAIAPAIAAPQSEYVLADLELLRKLELPILREEPLSGVGLAKLRPEQRVSLTYYSHSRGRCGGYELLGSKLSHEQQTQVLDDLHSQELKMLTLHNSVSLSSGVNVEADPLLLEAFEGVSADAQKNWVSWLSSFETRYHSGSQANRHVEALKERLTALVVEAGRGDVEVEEISHRRTGQRSLRARIKGVQRPEQIVVVGGHLDSTVGWFSRGRAPGADDNASGSANVIEAFRILLSLAPPERTIEFFWYAAEEIGLVGSAEIAQNYRESNKDVIGVLQLDMTLHAGDGAFVIASMQDFTSPWLNQLLISLNEAYSLGASILADQCGYGCSDHASWHRQGYPALMPFESSFANMNKKIHTVNDVINEQSNFEHSATFTKIALAFAWDLANSNKRQP